MSKIRPLQWLMLLALLALLAGQAVHAGRAEEPAAIRFDERFREIDEDVVLQSEAHGLQLLAELKTLLPPDDPHRQRMFDSLRCVLDFNEDNQRGLAFARAGVAAADQAKDNVALARFRLCEAAYVSLTDSNQASLAAYEAGIAAARRSDDPLLVAFGLTSRGAIYSIMGNQAAALLDFLEAQRMFDAKGRSQDGEDNLFNIAIAYRRMGEFDKAEDYLRQYESTVRKRNDVITLVSVILQRGYLHEEKGEFAAAESAFREALKLSKDHDDEYSKAMPYLALAGVQAQSGRGDLALISLGKAEALFKQENDQSNQGQVELDYGLAYAARKDHRQAMAHFDRAEGLIRDSGNLRYLRSLYLARSSSHEALGEYAAALADLQAALATGKTLDEKMHNEQTQLLRHQFDAQRRDLENARLNAEKNLREQEVVALTKARNWQWATIVLGGVLMVILIGLVVRQLVRARRLQVLALTDALTGVANRRRIERYAGDQIAESLAQKRSFTILTLDVDYFKRINDSHGHLAGDQVLVQVARVCQTALREFDVIGRTGGEEFLVVLPRSQLAQGAQVAERLRASVEELVLDDVAPGLKATISLGVAEFRAEDRDLKELMRRADNALYRAKANGRNRVELEP